MKFKELPDATGADKIRFMKWFKVGAKNECWYWLGNTDGRYGKFSFRSEEYKAHRVSFYIFKGIKPSIYLDVCHECDNPSCVNPYHLFEGTRSENLLDCSRKGRKVVNPKYGEDNPAAKLTEIQIREIRERYIPRKVTTRFLAKEYGVARSLVHRIVTRQVWKTV